MDIKRLMVKLNQIFSQYVGKIMYALFLMSILETIASLVLLSPLTNLLRGGAGALAVRAATFVFAFIVICVWLCFQFGFAVMLLKMTRREYTNLGFLFIGFRRLNPAGKVIGAFGFVIALLAIAARFIARLIFFKINPDFNFEMPDLTALQDSERLSENAEIISSAASDTLTFILIFLGVLFVLSLVVLIRFVFVFQLHFDNPSMPVARLFKKSAVMMRKNVFRLIVFALRAGGKPLVIALVLAVLVNFIPEKSNSGLSVLNFILDMVYFINMYTAMIRIYLTVPVLYNEILNPKLEIEA